jgi:membrane protease YdiL (CAAX protease family)
LNTGSRHFAALILLGYLAAVLLGAALLAPVLFGLGQRFLAFALAQGWRDSSSIGWIVKAAETTAMPGYFDRAALLVALAGMWPLFRALRVTRSETIGDESWPLGFRNASLGFLVAVVLLAVMGAMFDWLSVCRISDVPPWWIIGPPLVSGIVVGCLEEFLFRGAMLGVLRRSLRPRTAMLLTTAIFAALHFLKPPARDIIATDDVDWTSGFLVLMHLFDGFGEWRHLLAEFLLLFAVGWVLAAARVATGGLGLGIGIHAGLVAGMKYLSQVTTPRPAFRRGEFFPWISENHCKSIVGSYVGLAPIGAVLLMGAVTLWFCSRSRQPGAEGRPEQKRSNS